MAGLRFRLRQISRRFWFLPAVMTLAALALAQLGTWLSTNPGTNDGAPTWLYGGGVDGSRSILAAVASSSIGVGGTVFSITIAALSYAAGTMGPRLLQNFTEDRGNQVTLGVFISTFAFSLYSLRTVTGGDEGDPFVPHYNVTLALILALCCIAALVFFLGHVTSSINTTRVVNLLAADLRSSLLTATEQTDPEQDVLPPPGAEFWARAETLSAKKGGYLQLVDHEGLVDLAVETGTVIRLLVRPGDYLYPNSPIAEGVPTLPDGIYSRLTVGTSRTREQDVEHAVRLLAEVGTRALSPSTNDPFTAIDVIDRFGDALCTLEDREWPTGVHSSDGEVRLVAATSDFGGLVDTMFDQMRQFGAGAPAVSIRMLEVFAVAARVLDDPGRRAVVTRHATKLRDDALGATRNADDRVAIERRHRAVLEAAG
ncbi:DUF2254 domain-containing protein [Dietzia cercidiphylli]|uniref:DUF2254 domain-containing protein n=1 Tax=Dietzia cercidiphylli TaxID=498199 RepID=A0ABN2IHB6_9ACTN|nr:DUF2254 domain-containing protein [Dietzia cercidiphylli]MBB1047719.1 DUF2254 domain-containing protein [Dietzia cercidiphylli]